MTSLEGRKRKRGREAMPLHGVTLREKKAKVLDWSVLLRCVRDRLVGKKGERKKEKRAPLPF